MLGYVFSYFPSFVPSSLYLNYVYVPKTLEVFLTPNNHFSNAVLFVVPKPD